MTEWHEAQRQVAALRTLGRGSRYDRANRISLLGVHVLGGLFIGTCFVLVGVPAPWFLGLGIEAHDTLARTLVAWTPLTGALLLALGLTLGRKMAVEAAGMVLLLAWEITGIVAVLHWAAIAHPGPVQYQLGLYGLPALLMVVHLTTLLLYLTDQRRARREAGGGHG